AVNVARVCARLLAPVVPRFAKGVEEQTGAPLRSGDSGWLEETQIREPKPLVRRVEDEDLEKLSGKFVGRTAAGPSKEPAKGAARRRVAWHGALRHGRQAGPHRGGDRRGRSARREGEVMGLFSWLKKKPAVEGEPPAVEERAETTAEVAEALDSHNGAIRVDAARAMLDRA